MGIRQIFSRTPKELDHSKGGFPEAIGISIDEITPDPDAKGKTRFYYGPNTLGSRVFPSRTRAKKFLKDHRPHGVTGLFTIGHVPAGDSQ